MLHKPCAAKQHKTRRWQQVQLQLELHNDLGQMCAIPMGWTHQTDAAGCTWL
jgi:hypothetical protein